ncbi:Glu/Leu/Phe/Val dehydrogenase [Mycolicibacterium sp. P9-64]|uniref:Glu/Leu/Phe/Val family dehydrogenase n=1 Tax=Mycolicibacterium sp. P9-64 TaxID=2024612 RepID=UPI0011EFE6A9|nr:Glu/Leu/Phe/Val dehydrogenase dimerization domain-containing protein [Mycolicibacterium sp. P9-64]KAA0078837.1 Glu/Leu/Phe/Val dehydrogenase [Mycolicibacterium sp. P9-64]
MSFELLDECGAKKIVLCRDAETGLRGVIAIHSTTLGPAAGGLRMKAYADEREAMRDALRLARAMTYKYAASGIAVGGAKAVIIGDPSTHKSDELLRSFGRFIEELGGEYSAGEDVGTNGHDMEILAESTQWLVSLPEEAGGPGDVSHTTARGVRQAMRACAEHVFGSPELTDRSVAIQGLGQVGAKLARLLAAEGARLVVADIDDERARAVADEVGARVAAPEDILESDVDIVAPCALGDAVNEHNVNRIHANIVAGAANNVMASEAIADRLQSRGRVYAVDYVANAGGIVYDDWMIQRPRPATFDHDAALARVDAIYDRTREVLQRATADELPYRVAAERLAEATLHNASR